jgi:SHS2 domain-containing protein
MSANPNPNPNSNPNANSIPTVRYSLPQPFRDLEHTADVGVAVEGASPEEALARLVLAYAALLTGGEPVAPERDERIAVPGDGYVGAALALLRELLFRFAVERVIPAACEPHRIGDTGADVTVAFGRYDPERHTEGLDLKAVTWHAARFEPEGAAWRAQVVFDI